MGTIKLVVILFIVCVVGLTIKGCSDAVSEMARIEQQRRAALTPEQQDEEDRQRKMTREQRDEADRVRAEEDRVRAEQKRVNAEVDRRASLTAPQRAKEDNDKANLARAQEEAKRVKAEEDRLEAIQEAARKAKEEDAEQKERKRRAEEEYESNGLVLLHKTLKGTIGGDITGEVVSRRGGRLGYAQIVFTLHDKDGAVVGNALANVNGLAPGEKWKFKASTLGTRFHSYKVSDLSGF